MKIKIVRIVVRIFRRVLIDAWYMYYQMVKRNDLSDYELPEIARERDRDGE